MNELSERQICLGCKKKINLLIDGFRCLDCQFFFCEPCARYHFGKTDISPVTGEKDGTNPFLTPTDLSAKAREILEKAKKATKGILYAHAGGDCYGPECSARGPFFRWLKISEVEPEYQKHVADPLDDAKYYASVDRDTITEILQAFLKQREALESALKYMNTWTCLEPHEPDYQMRESFREALK